MRKSRIYATILTTAILMLTAYAILGSNREDPPVTVTETITVTALAGEPAQSDAHARLRRYLQSYNPYTVPRACLEIRAGEGDLFDILNQCTPDRQLLGQWRVDKLSGTVVRRR
jgi:hypothetical protein